MKFNIDEAAGWARGLIGMLDKYEIGSFPDMNKFHDRKLILDNGISDYAMVSSLRARNEHIVGYYADGHFRTKKHKLVMQARVVGDYFALTLACRQDLPGYTRFPKSEDCVQIWQTKTDIGRSVASLKDELEAIANLSKLG